MRADLHMHTTFSDGRKSVEEIIELAKQEKVDVIAITDHDTIKDVEKIKELAATAKIKYIPGVELSTIEDEKSVHILGYFTDDSYKLNTLTDFFDYMKSSRETRTERLIVNLKKYHNIELTFEEIASGASGIIARPHVAKAIIKKYPEYTHDRVFDELIGNHCKAYIPTAKKSVKEGIDFLREHGCKVVLAHPTLLNPKIQDKVLNYDFDGIEAVYFLNKPGDEERFRELAKKRNMFVTGGSDYHGIEGDTKHGCIGQIGIEGNDLKRFLENIENSEQIV